MSPVDFNTLDVYGLIDADTAEARAFTTYMGYWGAIAGVIEDRYGIDFHQPLVNDLKARRPVKKLTGQPFKGDDQGLRELLLGAWTQELGLYAVDDDDPRLMLQNLWNNVYAYYATSRAAAGFLLVRNNAVPTSHRKTLKALAASVKGSPIFPQPWSLTCTRHGALSFKGFDQPPQEVSNLAASPNPYDLLAKCLKTTRGRRLEDLKRERRQYLGRSQLPKGEGVRIDKSCEPTTVFDFLWRSRTRSNYGDPSMFYVGTLDHARSERYVQSVRFVTGATMLLFEVLVAQRAPDVVAEAGVHFISRDRTRFSGEVLGERLRAIGVLD